MDDTRSPAAAGAPDSTPAQLRATQRHLQDGEESGLPGAASDPFAPFDPSSTLFQAPRRELPPPPDEGSELCRSAMVLRVLLYVHAALGAGLAFTAPTLSLWAADFALAAAVAVPASLLWLIGLCALRKRVVQRSAAVAWVVSAGGAAAAVAAWWPLQFAGIAPQSTSGPLAPALAGALLAAGFHAWWQARERSRLPAATMARLAELQTRIRPHFLFNTLNTAISLVQIDPPRAEEVLEDLADLFRAALLEEKDVSTLGEEIVLSRRYLAIEQLRFGDRLRVEWDLDPGAADARLPPLLLQPLVENAVRHGVEPSDRGGSIQVRTRKRLQRVVITVTNTVAGEASPAGHGIGLSSVRERLRLLHDLNADVESGPVDGGLFRVRLSVPA